MAILDSNAPLKMAILGLSNDGKTSIIRTLTHEFDMLTMIRPTINVERLYVEFMGRDLVFWDFGGQDLYREKYLENPAMFFGGINALFYVVDVQNPSVLQENINYFRKIFVEVQKFSPNALLSILFHKDDPLLDTDPKMAKLKDEFLVAIQPILEENKKQFFMYKTSIYNAMSIITAFSQPLFSGQSLYSNITNILRSFCENYNLLFAMLFTKGFFEIGSSLSPRISAKQSHELITEFFTQFNPNFPPGEFFQMVIGDKNLLASRFSIKYGKTDLPFYLALTFDEQSLLEDEGFKAALNHMNENLEKILINVDLNEIVENIEKKTS